MRTISALTSSIGCLAMLSTTVLADCAAYGMDFQDGGSYFQNSNSPDPFTFVSEFNGCQNDTANNILVNPSGDQYLCTDTNLQPDDTDMMSTCPLNKNQLFSGYWSVIVISNNGNAEPIAYERDFSLSVGPQSTSTVTPTVTAVVTTTPVANFTTTTTDITSTTLPVQTVTLPSTTITKTVTITPPKVVLTTTSTLFTVTNTAVKVSVIKSTTVRTASCKLPTKASTRDPPCHITPTIIRATALETAQSAKFRRLEDSNLAVLNRNKAQYLKERAERVEAAALQRRAPDPQPLIVTETNATLYPTTTSTVTQPTSTLTVFVAVTSTSTITPNPVTVYKGRTTVPNVTVTAPTPTKIKTKYLVPTVKTTITTKTTVTITSKTTPAAVKTACRKAGGVLV